MPSADVRPAHGFSRPSAVGTARPSAGGLAPNPTLTPQDRLPVSDLAETAGPAGENLTLLRPVGTASSTASGSRVQRREYGVIAGGTEVEAISLSDRTIVVRPLPDGESTPVA